MAARLICISHSPLIGHTSSGLPQPAFEKDLRTLLNQLKEEVAAYDPGLVVIFGPDHFNGFYYDVMPPFCIGIAAEGAGDYGGPTGTMSVASDRARDLASYMLAHGFDPAVSYRMRLDHGYTQPLSFLFDDPRAVHLLPVYINSVAAPQAGYARTAAFGRSVGDWLQGLDVKTLIIGSGGLSHDPPVPDINTVPPEPREYLIRGHSMPMEVKEARQRAVIERVREFYHGKSNLLPLNPDWDQWVMDRFSAGDLSTLAGLTTEAVLAKGGRGGQEIRTWIAAFSALSSFGPYLTGASFYEPSDEWLVGMGVLAAYSL